MHQSLTADQNRRVIEWLGERGSEFYLESNSGLYGSERFEEAGEPVIREYINRKGDPRADSMTVRQVFPDMIFGGDLQRDDINKISYILTSPSDLADAEAAFPELHHGSWGGRGGTPLFGDMGVKDIHKAHAIDVLLEHLGANLADTIAFGDATVDRTMLEHCAIGVAMGNAPDDLKAIAQLVTDDVSHDGLAKAFVELGLVAKPA